MKRAALITIMTLVTANGPLPLSCGIALATSAAPSLRAKNNACPPGYQLDPQNSQQCQSLSPAGPETSTAGCQTAGYANDPLGSPYCVNSAGQDTQGNYRR